MSGGESKIKIINKLSSAWHCSIKKIINEFVKWFENTFGTVECSTLDPYEKREVCPVMLKESFLKILALLEENNIDLYE